MTYNPNGLVIWEGASALDGAPIVIIATGLEGDSRNAKTGDMIQTWIMRQDIAPHHATKSGADESVCGMCPHRPALNGSCYVTVWQAPLSVWNAYRRGAYRRADASEVAAIFAGRKVRLGSYGDPAAGPFWVWQSVVAQAAGVTGYTHQWATCNPAFRTILMASVDTPAEAARARAADWRFFRIRLDSEPLGESEFVCPASAEAGYKTDCASCRACGGLSSKAKASPVIIAHGASAKRFAMYRNGSAV